MKLSIITINLNNAEDLKKTIQSVVTQKFTDYEFLIIDGGSTDESVNIIKQFENNIDFWMSEPDKGIFNAMNKGITRSSGEYLLMLNAGDVLYNERTLSIIFDENNFREDILYGNAYLESEGEIFGEKDFSNPITYNFFNKTSLSHQTTFIKKTLHDQIGFYDEKLKFASDWKFFVLAFCKYDVSARHLDQYVAICNCDGLTWNPKNFGEMGREMAEVRKKYFSRFVDDYEHFEQALHKPSPLLHLFSFGKRAVDYVWRRVFPKKRYIIYKY